MGINYGANKVRFPPPCRSARACARPPYRGVEEVGGGVQVTAAVTVEREGGDKPVWSPSRWPATSSDRGTHFAPTIRRTRSAYSAPTSSGVLRPRVLNQRATSMQSDSTATVVPGTSGTSNSPDSTPS